MRQQLINPQVLSRALVWGVIFGLLYVLKSFTLLIFLTFLFSYLMAHAAEKLQPTFANRTLRVALVSLLLVAILGFLGSLIFPRVIEQMRTFIQRLPVYMQTVDESLFSFAEKYPSMAQFIPVTEEIDATASPGNGEWSLKNSISGNMLHDFLGFSQESTKQQSMRQLMTAAQSLSQGMLAIISSFLLALLFSILIVFDLPRLTQSAQRLKESKLKYIYSEVAPSIVGFSKVLGRAMEAQIYVAIVNTVLTAIGLLALGLGEKLAFLSMIVFLCSFIPVAGVFISSVPICLVALQESGFTLVLLAIALITLIHLIEAYFLNPHIYGHHLKINPVIVLIILTICGKLFHFWGLLLGVPVCSYLFSLAVKEKPVSGS